MTCIHIESMLSSCRIRYTVHLQTPSETSAYLLASSGVYLGGVEYASFLQHETLLDAKEGREFGCRQIELPSTVLFVRYQILSDPQVPQRGPGCG